MICETTLGQTVLWHTLAFNEIWITDVHSGNTKLWIDLRRNALEKAQTWLREIAERSDGDGILVITSGLEKSAEYLTNYRGSMCGTEISLRLAIQIWVLTKAIQDIEGEDAANTLRHIAAMHACPEIIKFANGETVR